MVDEKNESMDLFKEMAEKIIRPPLRYARGYNEKEMRKPMIGIANTWTELNPGHVHINKLAEKVKEGIRSK